MKIRIVVMSYPDQLQAPQTYNNAASNAYPDVYPQPPSTAYPRFSSGHQPQQTQMFVPLNTPVDTQVFNDAGTFLFGLKYLVLELAMPTVPGRRVPEELTGILQKVPSTLP
jgi:hypothetical protein